MRALYYSTWGSNPTLNLLQWRNNQGEGGRVPEILVTNREKRGKKKRGKIETVEENKENREGKKENKEK